MLRTAKMFGLMALGLALLPLSAAGAKEKSLFNGRNLTGWKGYVSLTGGAALGRPPPPADTKPEDVFFVKDGVIHSTGYPYAFLRTMDNFTNYHLTMEWRWSKATATTTRADGRPWRNSGLLVVAGDVPDPDVPGSPWPQCYEIEIGMGGSGSLWILRPGGPQKVKSDPAKIDAASGARYSERMRNAHRLAIKDTEKPPTEWNSYDVTLINGHLVVKLNGELVNEATGLDVMPSKIGLQAEGEAVEFRNIRITPLK